MITKYITEFFMYLFFTPINNALQLLPESTLQLPGMLDLPLFLARVDKLTGVWTVGGVLVGILSVVVPILLGAKLVIWIYHQVPMFGGSN